MQKIKKLVAGPPTGGVPLPWHNWYHE